MNIQETNEDIISINFKAFFKILWQEKFLLLLCFALMGGIGLWYAFSKPEEFVSEGKILPEVQSQNGKLGGLAGLAGLAGFDLNSLQGAGTDAVRPDLYPDVLQSTPFFMDLFKQMVTTRENKQMSFEAFYHRMIEEGKKTEEKNLKLFPVKENGFFVVNHLTELRIKDLKQRISANIDKKSGVISISVKMPDPVVSAGLARFSMIYLTEYVTNYRTDKAKKDLEFLAKRVDAAKGKYYNDQIQKAQYNDQFQLPTIRLQAADIQRERIESEYRLSSNFYNELLKKYEEAKIKVQQETPVFKVLEPPTVPTLKSEPKRAMILLAFLFLGGILGVMIALIRKQNYKKVLAS